MVRRLIRNNAHLITKLSVGLFLYDGDPREDISNVRLLTGIPALPSLHSLAVVKLRRNADDETSLPELVSAVPLRVLSSRGGFMLRALPATVTRQLEQLCFRDNDSRKTDLLYSTFDTARFTSLRALRATCTSMMYWDAAVLQPRQHSGLTILVLRFTGDSTVDGLQILRAPSLQHLTLVVGSRHDHDLDTETRNSTALLAFIRESAPPLREMRLHAVDISDDAFCKILDSVPSLELLKISCGRLTSMFVQQLATPPSDGGEWLCPRLEHLSYLSARVRHKKPSAEIVKHFGRTKSPKSFSRTEFNKLAAVRSEEASRTGLVSALEDVRVDGTQLVKVFGTGWCRWTKPDPAMLASQEFGRRGLEPPGTQEWWKCGRLLS